jgi:hypothetical protein
MARTFIVKHPDGTQSKRTTANREYPFALVHEVTRASRVAYAESSLENAQENVARYEAALADGTITESRSKWSHGGEYVNLYVGGIWAGAYVTDQKERPTDDALRAALQESIDNAKARVAQCEANVEQAKVSPEVTYGVLRWTSRRDLAEKAVSGEFSGLQSNRLGNKVYVVETEEVIKAKKG